MKGSMPNAGPLNFKLTSESTSYTPGKPISLTLTADSQFDGFLFYAESSAAPGKRVGSFTVPPKFQNNQARCKNSETANSVLTHTSGQKYEATQKFTFTPPAAGGDLTFHVIVTNKGDKGFTYTVNGKALQLKAGSSSPAEISKGQARVTTKPGSPVPKSSSPSPAYKAPEQTPKQPHQQQHGATVSGKATGTGIANKHESNTYAGSAPPLYPGVAVTLGNPYPSQAYPGKEPAILPLPKKKCHRPSAHYPY